MTALSDMHAKWSEKGEGLSSLTSKSAEVIFGFVFFVHRKEMDQEAMEHLLSICCAFHLIHTGRAPKDPKQRAAEVPMNLCRITRPPQGPRTMLPACDLEPFARLVIGLPETERSRKCGFEGEWFLYPPWSSMKLVGGYGSYPLFLEL